jgi:hypothetical protein
MWLTVAGETVMFPATYFVQSCPICGRALQVRLEYLGRSVTCQHCHGTFTAADPSLEPVENADVRVDNLLSRADDLLATATRVRVLPR